MSKDDVEIPRWPPRKRRVLEDQGATLDKWLAVWANDEGLPPSQRARAQAERDRRKRLAPDMRVGVIVGEEGMTPPQADMVTSLVATVLPTELHVIRPRHLRRVLAIASCPVVTHDNEWDLIRASTTVFAAPKEAEKPAVVQGVWEAVRYARHRRLPVSVVMPDGKRG